MADNTTLNAGTGGDVIASDDIAGVKHQRVKLSLGADGTAADAPVGGGTEAGVLRVTVASDSTGVLSVDDNGASLTVDGTVTANAGTNLNTSALALEAGGNLAGAATSLAVMDDWDETDRAKVNVIAGQAGITAGAGAVAANTPRVTHASDDPAVTALQLIDNAISGNEMQVDVVAALPAGSNNIGNVTAVGAAAEDAAASGNPVLVGGRYDSSSRTLETGDAGAIALNASGQVLVEIAAGAGSGGTAAADDADFTAGTTSATPIMGAYQSSPTAVTDGDMGIVGITADRELKVNVSSGGIAGKAVDSAAGGTDEGVVTVAVRDDALATLTPIEGDYTTQRVNARGALWVALDSTAAQTVTLAAGTATNEVVGDAAENAAASGNPVLVGGRYDSTPRTLGNGDVGAAALNASGQMLVEIAAGAGSGGTAAADDADFTAGTTSGTPIQGVYQSTPSNVTDGDLGMVGITQTRAMRVSVDAAIPAGANNIGDVDVLTVPADPFGANADAASATGSISAKLRFIAATGIPITGTVTVGSHAVTNAGTFATQVDGAALTALQLIDDPVIADDAAFTPATSKVMMAGFEADETATDSVDEGDAGAARMTLDRKQIVTNYSHAAGGATPVSTVSAASTNATSLKGSAGTVYSVTASNVNAAVRYLKFYNKATAPTVGTDTPVYVLPLPGNTAGAGITHSFPTGLNFSTGIAWALTVEATVAGTTGVSASEHVVSIAYI